jgi:tRNA 5-methylaminomethyl-2-thiouridine biosynthesis bifunctional protein
MTPAAATPSEIDWTEGEPPRSRTYGDVYFSRDDGLAESRAVFLAGCGLPDAWAGRRAVTVAELGFGTGLNIVALLDLWRRTRPAGGRLTVFSVEAHVMAVGDARRALAAWPELSDLAAMLLDRWPRPTRGFHRLDFPALGATLDLATLEAGEALAAWSGKADAWFLDGFSPAINPTMWRPELMDLVAARSAPGARVATYTVAGAVRRALATAGFELERKAGFGRKRERLEGRLPGPVATAPPAPRVAIVGGGIAGAALSRAFAALGLEARVFVDPASSPASGGPAALVAPRLDAGLGPPAALFAQAFHRAVDLYRDVDGAVISTGALQLASGPDDARRFAKIAAADLFDPTRVRTIANPTSDIGEAAPQGLSFDEALVVEPAAILTAWLPTAEDAEIGAVVREGDTWRLRSPTGAPLGEAEIVVVAAGIFGAGLIPSLALGAVRGQASWVVGPAPGRAVLFGGYAMPTRDGMMFGATHDRDDLSVAVREADHARNRATLAAALPRLAAQIADRPARAHVGLRATTRDFLPLAGGVGAEDPGLFVLSGLGSRGFCLAPLLAEHVAALALGAPSPLPSDIAAIIDPDRFARRDLRSLGHSRNKPAEPGNIPRERRLAFPTRDVG